MQNNHLWLLLVVIGLGWICQTLLLVNWIKSYLSKSINHFDSNNLLNLLQKPLMDLNSRLTQTQGDLRQSLSESLSRHFIDTQERLERSLTQNRQELQNGLIKSTQALETKFQSLEQQVGIRL